MIGKLLVEYHILELNQKLSPSDSPTLKAQELEESDLSLVQIAPSPGHRAIATLLLCAICCAVLSRRGKESRQFRCRLFLSAHGRRVRGGDIEAINAPALAAKTEIS